ncbi:MAG: DNRLRE domain-containing protein [Candidatus Omnitrophota bacterium]
MGKKVFVLLLLAFGFLPAGLKVSFADQEFTFIVAQDAWVNESNPDENYGNNTYLSVKDRSGLAEAYLRFSDADLGLLKGLQLTSATLFLNQYQYNYSAGDQIQLHKVVSDWNEGEITWNTKPLYETVILSSANLAEGNNMWREWQGFENCVNSWVNGQNYGLVLENNLDGQGDELFARFYSSESLTQDVRPFLRVTAAPEPVSCLLFLVGGASFAAVRKLRKK